MLELATALSHTGYLGKTGFLGELQWVPTLGSILSLFQSPVLGAASSGFFGTRTVGALGH